jgi:hypothetical protein
MGPGAPPSRGILQTNGRSPRPLRDTDGQCNRWQNAESTSWGALLGPHRRVARRVRRHHAAPRPATLPSFRLLRPQARPDQRERLAGLAHELRRLRTGHDDDVQSQLDSCRRTGLAESVEVEQLDGKSWQLAPPALRVLSKAPSAVGPRA